MDINNEVQDIFRDVFDDEDMVINDYMSAKDVEDWDSLAQMNLIVAMEKHFKIKFKVDEIANVKNVGEMIKLVEMRVNK